MKRSGLRLTGYFAALALSMICSKSFAFGTALPGNSSSSGGGDSGSGNYSSTAPSSSYLPLAWESSSKPERKAWSQAAIDVVSQEYQRLNRASDITYFCPRYNSLSKDQRINVWAQFFAAVSYYESGWSATSRMQETTMGTDPVTGRPVYSEGLLQLSYQDVQWAPYCEFDWSRDRSLASNDPRKTILNARNNLNCGIKIMAGQIDRKGAIILNSGVYWAVLKSGGRYQKLSGIASITKRMSLCQ